MVEWNIMCWSLTCKLLKAEMWPSSVPHKSHEKGIHEYVWPVYRKLTGDASGSRTADKSAVDEQMKEALLHEDLDIMIDLQEANEGTTSK